MLEGEEEEGLRLWHLVKSSEDPEIPKHRKSSMRERERAKAIPEIYLTRLLSMKVKLSVFLCLSTCLTYLYLSLAFSPPVSPLCLPVSLSVGDSAEVCGRRIRGDPQYEAPSSDSRQIFLRLPGRHG